ncbi:ArnT family glycosyltransferase [Neobacillus massiliamazoniensis]|uniref:Undecaprenyl phosphate-alpha-4-amino-4-deoxy-L-arabinose arabinosyl transferase n=1 Tax=Neobacillus massiliamazoniensis TaxID=1499688 RepID=A0A0U1NRQ2_9BACI|nr:glycosyltransferase family 39 protein [Neobacillus massiliamazoniensis]CRK80726.1 Undecaprenyl phosphate-alpha-4-amino-4-deoxy-L-arabinose arabinosyl transferase [Neobacillus massiliamazoniensis]
MDRLHHNKSHIIYFSVMLILLAIAAFNLFYQLGKFPIYSWDEARHGVSAYEMVRNHNYIVNTYRGNPDYWNLKPPLSFWTIIAGYKIAGFNALGLRIFSAIFAFLTIIMVAAYGYKKHGKLASIISTVVLLTSTQYITNHSARTGDADSLFIFLFTIAILSLLLWEQNNILLYVSGLAFAFAFLTKSWHAGNIAIIIGLYLFLTGKYKLLTLRNWISLGICMILPILIWGFIRYQYDGVTFFKGMIMYDLLHRSSTPIEGHIGGVFYYVSIISRYFINWIYVICILGLLFLFNRNFPFKKIIASEKRNELIGLCLWVLIPFILFTFAKTKVRWYILPIYPALAIITGALASKLILKGKWITKVILVGAILSVSIFYEIEICTYLNNPPTNNKLSLIEMITNKKSTEGDSLYIYQPSKKVSWAQSDVLTAELSDNLHVNNGDFEQFLQKDKDLLLVPKKLFSQQLISSNHLKVIDSDQWGYMVEKSS